MNPPQEPDSKAYRETLAAVSDGSRRIDPGASVVVGTSGGPDSMTLLDILDSINRFQPKRWRIVAAYLDHGIRDEESAEDGRLVEGFCRYRGIEYHSEKIDAPSLAAERKGTLEEISRAERYRFLERVAADGGSEVVCVGHHADDNVETILHRIVRGTGLRGLRGIGESRSIRRGSSIRLIRPLLGLRRDEILSHLKEFRVPFRIDATNLAVEATRSRIRNELLPHLQERYNPAVADALLRLARQAALASEHMEASASRLLDFATIKRDDRRLCLDAGRIAESPAALQMEVLFQAVLSLGGPEKALGFDHIDALRRLLTLPTGAKVDLPGAIEASKEYDRIAIGPAEEPPAVDLDLAPLSVATDGKTALDELGVEFRAALESIDRVAFERHVRSADPMKEWLDADALRPPLVARRCLSSDCFRPLGGQGSKKVSAFLSDKKTPRWQRGAVTALIDLEGVVWVVGHRIDHRVRVTESTRRVLRLRATFT